MIDRGAKPPLTRQCELLGLNHSGMHYTPRPVPQEDLRLMRRIDEIQLELPYYDARRIAMQLIREGHDIGRLHISMLVRRMSIETLYRKPRTCIPGRQASIYPYLLSELHIERVNQVWASDISYIPMARGFMYPMAILDITSCRVLAFRLSKMLTADFCVAALEEALAHYETPEIFNTDHGAQFTSEVWLQALKTAGLWISMDGKGRWIDNVFIGRLWRSVKYEDPYLHAYRDGLNVREHLRAYFDFYSCRRTHQSLDYRTPDEGYLSLHETEMDAAAYAQTVTVKTPQRSAHSSQMPLPLFGVRLRFDFASERRKSNR